MAWWKVGDKETSLDVRVIPMPDWAAARAAMMLDPTVTNLNTGSFGPLPREVFSAATSYREHLAAEPMDFLTRKLPPLLWESRRRLAAYLNGDPCRLVFTANVSAAINLIASSLRLASPGEILLSDQEYGAMHWCWERAAQRQALTLRVFQLPQLPASPEAIVEAATALMTARTRLLFFSHVLSPTGMVIPARRLCEEARRRGILSVIDGAHAPAMIELDVASIGCDFYAANCHKWMLAPTGSGFFTFAPGAGDRLHPLHVSWGWHPDSAKLDERDDFGSTQRIRFLEFEGTRDPCPWICVPTAIEFQTRLGMLAIRQHNQRLVAYVRRTLGWLKPATPEMPELSGYLTAFWLPAGTDPVALRDWLWRTDRIEAPVIKRPHGLLIRVSTHFYNTPHEVDRLSNSLKRFYKMG